MPAILLELVAAVVSLALGGFASSSFARALARLIEEKLLKGRPQASETYHERLQNLAESLTASSAEVDEVLRELRTVAEARAQAVKALENDLKTLEAQEKDLQSRVAALQSTPLPVAEHFAALISQGEGRSARRDYVLFGAGVVVSTASAILLRLLGLA